MDTLKTYGCPVLIEQKIEEEKDSVKVGTDYERTPDSKRLLNTATQELKLLNRNKNDSIQTFLQGPAPTEATDYSLWKATKKIKQAKRPSSPLRPSQGTGASSNIERHALLLNT
jgi:hypothetical protein